MFEKMFGFMYKSCPMNVGVKVKAVENSKE